MVMLIGMLGLCLDLSRMYIAKNELQAFSDAATLAAARHLDGTSTGITYARNAATSYPDEWYFQSAPPDTVTVTFAAFPGGPWEANPADPKDIKYVHVVATGNLTLYFMPGFSVTAPTGAWMFTIARTQSITGDAISGEYLLSGLKNGLIPYSPDAINIADPNYGYTVGSQYTLRWPPPGQRTKNRCKGDLDAGYTSSDPSNERGFIDIGDPNGGGGGFNGNGSAFIREAIVSNVQSHPLYQGDTIINVSGNRGTESDALRERFGQDMDTESSSISDYYEKFHKGRAN
ncbi:MAG: Tad domain-containing protein, partial [Acidobacteria bacterium]|nr:Tad domain-containing protein [Acidobacteriota bacterium]